MRKLISTLFIISLFVAANGQTVLTYKKHGLVPDERNPMLLAKYAEPGDAGKNALWDFSNLEMTKSFVGNIDNPAMTKSANLFSNSTSVLEEFGNYFFFETNKNGIRHCGYASGSGTTTIEYTKPLMKMQYPFRYGSSFSGDYSGIYTVNSNHYGDIAGNYSVSADGAGTLILPGNIKYSNALRVKEVKSYTNQLKNSSYSVVDETYRWYIDEHRFPVLVLIKSTYTYNNGNTSESFNAAYNPVIVSNFVNDDIIKNNGSDLSVETYPNPYVGHVNIKFDVKEEAFVNVSVYNSTGKLVSILENNKLAAGTKEYKFSAKEFGVGTGSYLVRVTVGDETVSEKVMEM